MTKTITTLSSREFNQDTSRAKKAARKGPVFITDRGRPAHVLMTIDDYQALTGGPMSLAEALASPRVRTLNSSPRGCAGHCPGASTLTDVRARYGRRLRAAKTRA